MTMSPAASFEDYEKPSKEQNGCPEPSNKKNGSQMVDTPKKVYSYRNSVLTDLMEVNHLQTVYNISVAVFTLLLVNSVIYYLVAPKIFWSDVKVIVWGASNVQLLAKMWVCFNAFALLNFVGFKYWVRLRNRFHKKLTDLTFMLAFITGIALFFYGTVKTITRNEIRPIANFAIMAEQARIFMKVYSFVFENVPRVLQYNPSKDGNQEKTLIPTFKHYLYFLFAPVLIYRDSYPRKQGRSFKFIFSQLFKFVGCIFITYCVFMRFVVDVFRGTGLNRISLPDASLTLAGAMVVGSMMMFMIFYGILHSWLNVFAELLEFGDREFYQDWWNSTSFSQYYRKWNLVVYDWIYAYVYLQSHKMGLGRSVSTILVFLSSALVHEYIIALSLGFFYPVLMVIYSTIGVVVMFLTQRRKGQFWNTFMWSMLFSGWGVIICLYASEWYSRANCPGTNDPVLDFFIPRSWNSTCRIIDYS